MASRTEQGRLSNPHILIVEQSREGCNGGGTELVQCSNRVNSRGTGLGLFCLRNAVGRPRLVLAFCHGRPLAQRLALAARFLVRRGRTNSSRDLKTDPRWPPMPTRSSAHNGRVISYRTSMFFQTEGSLIHDSVALTNDDR